MKKVGKTAYCVRCGDEISDEELTMFPGATCALCNHMQLEALDVRQEHTESAACLPLLHGVSVNAR